MQTGIILLSVMVAVTVGAKVPTGFVPLPPLPVNYHVPPNPKSPTPPQTPTPGHKFTPKTKAAPKTTPAPITKKQTAVKTNKPVVTKAPFTQPSTQSTTNCQFSFNVPNSNCKGGNTAVQQALTAIKQQLDTTRKQHQAQNAAVQSMISQLKSQQASYVNKIADLQNEVQNLVAAFNSLGSRTSGSSPAPVIFPTPTSTTGSVFAVQQAVKNVQTNLRDAVRDFDTKIFNLSLVLNDNQVQESKVQQNIQSRLLQQTADISRLSQQVTNLNQLLQQVQTNGTGTGNGMTSADVAKLQSQIQQVSTEIQNYDAQQQARINSLSSNTSALQSAVNAQSADIRNTKNSAQLMQASLSKAERDVKNVHDAFGQFRLKYEPTILKVDQDVKDLKKNVSAVDTGLQQVRNTTFGFAMKSGKNLQELNGLKAQTSTLESRVNKINSDLTVQSLEIRTIKSGLTSLKSVIPMQTLNDMNNAILQILNNNATPQILTTLKNDLQTLQNRLNSLSLPPPPASG